MKTKTKITYSLDGSLGSITFEGCRKDYELFLTSLQRLKGCEIIKSSVSANYELN